MPQPTLPEPPLALAAVTATCTAFTKKKKRCRNQPKKGTTNGLCSVHQPVPEPASSSEQSSDESESDSEKEWCECGEHYVDPEDMWPDFADCMNCVSTSEKEYLEYCTWTIVQLDPHPIPNLKIFFRKKSFRVWS